MQIAEVSGMDTYQIPVLEQKWSISVSVLPRLVLATDHCENFNEFFFNQANSLPWIIIACLLQTTITQP